MANVAVYARVSTDDKRQDVMTQLLPLRDYCRAKGWDVYREYVDHASATDLNGRTAWRALMGDGAKRRFQTVVIWKLDRAWRSTRLMYQTLDAWELTGISFLSLNDPIDTTTPAGRFVLTILAALAEMERETISLRVRAGMDRARRQGTRIGRPTVTEQRGIVLGEIADRVRSGVISQRAAARELHIGSATFRRMLARQNEVLSEQLQP